MDDPGTGAMVVRASVWLIGVAGCLGSAAGCIAREDATGEISSAVGLEPTVGGESTLDVSIAGATGKPAHDPAIAWGDTRYLVVWEDDRSLDGPRVYVARVNPDGSVVDRSGILIAEPGLASADPAVAWTGTEWLVVWSDFSTGALDIAAATVSATGSVTQLGKVVATGAAERRPAVASNGEGAIVVWQSASDVRGATFAGGAFGAPFSIAATANDEMYPKIAASTGDTFLVTYQLSTADVWGQRVAVTGSLLGAGFAISNRTAQELRPGVGFNGTDFVVAWRYRTSEILASRVTTAGAVLDSDDGVTSGVRIYLGSLDSTTIPTVACDPGSCLFAWHRSSDSLAQQTALDLTLAGSTLTLSAAGMSQLVPKVAAQATGFMAVWQDDRTTVASILGARVDAGGTLLDPDGRLINTSVSNAQLAPAYARTTTSQLAVWSDARVLGNDIWARRYDSTGAKLDTRLVSGADAQQGTPVVDFDGTTYVVAWSDARADALWALRPKIYAARLAEDGTLLDPDGIQIATPVDSRFGPGPGAPVMASIGGVSLIAWDTGDSVAVLDDATGALTMVELCQFPPCEATVGPSVAWDPIGRVFVVVWAAIDASGFNAGLHGMRVDKNGSRLDPNPVSLTPTGVVSPGRPAIAFSGSQLVIAFEGNVADPTGGIFAARINTAGGLNLVDADAIPIATGGVARTDPTVVGLSSQRWAIAWTDSSNLATTGTDIHGATVLPDGTLEGYDYVLTANPENESAPAFQAGRNMRPRAYLVYQKERLDIGVTRSMRRAITY